jgi:uncharacterized protein YkwD
VALTFAAVVWALAGSSIQRALGVESFADRGGCPHSGELPSDHNLGAAATATLCLLNRERAAHGLPPFEREAHLDDASLRQSRDMAARHFFAHVNPDGIDPTQRIFAAGLHPANTTGENLAWGAEAGGTPSEIVKGWMHSPGHRANVLRRQFHYIGIGIVPAGPEPTAAAAASYTTDFAG